MNILIRVDSSKLIGSGHLMRCLTFAEQHRRDGAKVAFVCRNLEGNLSKLVKDKGFDLVLLKNHGEGKKLLGYDKWLTVSQERDALDTIEAMRTIGKVQSVMVDSYAIDETWEKMIRPYTDKIFVIDDLANRKHDCDFLLDQNFYLDMERRYDGLVPSSCKMLLGPEHALLRQEFYEEKKHLRKRDGSIHRILVFYGGSDLTDETTKAVNALIAMRLPEVEVDVIVGGSNENREEIREICSQYPFLHYHCQVSNMAEFMVNADLCLGAGGTTTWERLLLKLPAIVTAIAENQFKICEDCASAGLIQYLGRWYDVTVEDIIHAVTEFKKGSTRR